MIFQLEILLTELKFCQIILTELQVTEFKILSDLKFGHNTHMYIVFSELIACY